MPGPWEKYGATAPAETPGPWAKYGASTPVSGAAAIPGSSAGQLASARASMPAAPEQEDNLLGKIVGPVDAGLGLLSGMVSPIIAAPAGFIKSFYDEKTNGPPGSPEQNAIAIRDRLQYKPATVTGRRILETIGEAAPVLEALPGVGNDLANLGRATQAGTGTLRSLAAPTAAIQNAADEAAVVGGGKLRDLVRRPQEPSLSGVGAARSPEAMVRQQRAANLGLSPLTEGQATREPSQVRFERNIAKQPEGGPLNNRFVEQNQQILGKFDENFDETGAQAPTLRAAGGVVTEALVNEFNKAKANIRDAYAAAREAGQTAEPVPYKAVSDYLDTKNAEMTTNNAPMLNYVRAKLSELDPNGTGVIPVNELEELRKGAGRLTQDGTPNSAFIGDVKRAIDSSMDQATGALYQQARRMRENAANRFENAGAVDKLLRTKPGTNDRAVAVEDVTDHILRRGSLEDMLNVRRALQGTQSEQGLQAWKEVQGAGVRMMQDTLFPEYGGQGTSGVNARPSSFKKLVSEWDADGKLERLYGKANAEKIRDLADAAVDVNYSQGANTSGTEAALMDSLRSRFTGLAKILPGGRAAAEYIEGRAQSQALRKRVNQSLGQSEKP